MSQPRLLTWDVDVFAECYNVIRFQNSVPPELEDWIGNDLRNLVDLPARNDKSRSVLAAGESGKPVAFHSGDEYQLNKPFIADSSAISTELALDELYAAELLQIAAGTTSAKGADLTDAGRLAYFQRIDYILNIVGYLAAEKKLLLLYPLGVPASQLLTTILASFKKIYELLRIQNDLIDKQKVTGDINDLQFVTGVTFVKNKLFDTHALLSQILYTLVDNYIDTLGTWESYAAIVAHVSENITDDSDVLVMHYLPSLLRIASNPKDIPEGQVVKFHENFVKTLTADYAKVSGNGDDIDLSKTSIRIYLLVVKLLFFIAFIPWCKEQESRTKRFDFEKDILKYVEWLINYGTLEQVLSYSAESARPEARALYEQDTLYNFRPLLQKSFPTLKPVKFIYPGSDELLLIVKQRPELSNVANLCAYQTFTLSTDFCDTLVAPFFHSFIINFISHAAIVLTLLRDSEEDFLLSSANRKQLEPDAPASTARNGSISGGDFDNFVLSTKKLNGELSKSSSNGTDEGLNLNEIASRAELERFYMFCAYTYTHRKSLCEKFWEVDDSNIVGFIGWGISNNTSPLITATFCLLLGSLTFGGETASVKVWDILVNAQNGSIKRNDYSKISVDSIINSLTYYVDALTENLENDLSVHMKNQQKKQEFMFSSSSLNKTDAESSGPLSIQLSEDSIIFMSGFFMLVALIVENAKGSSPIIKNLRLAAFARFLPIITSYLKFDNLIISAKSLLNDNESSPVVFDAGNRTITLNLVLYLLSTFASDRECLELRYKIWIIVDRWLCYNINENDTNNSTPSEPTRYAGVSLSGNSSNSVKSELTKLKQLRGGISLKQSFQITLTNLSEVTNFVQLMQTLLLGLEGKEDDVNAMQLLYPADLGAGYRHKNQIGIWPYIEFLLIEVFGHTKNLKFPSGKYSLQRTLLDIIHSSLTEIDWQFLNEVAPNILVDLSKQNGVFASSELVSGELIALSYESFLKLHHAPAVLNYLFDDRANSVLFDIINTGSEVIANDETTTSLVDYALKSFEQLLNAQDAFIGKILPLLKNADTISGSETSAPMGYGTALSLAIAAPKSAFDNIYYPASLGTKGVTNFYEILSFHIITTAHFALYVGNANASIVKSSLSILAKISQSPLFVQHGTGDTNHLLKRNRLLSIFQNIDESLRIQYGFVYQMETITDLLQTKFSILKYLIENLPSTSEPSVAHFLLGYTVKADRLEIESTVGTSENGVLLLSLIELLISTLDLISEVDYTRGFKHHIGIGPSKLTSLIMQIVVQLCQNPISSKTTLQFLRSFDLFSKLLTVQTKIDDMTVWQTFKFEGDLQEGGNNRFVQDDLSCETFFSFISCRNFVLQYLSLELHDIKSITKREYYVNLLLQSNEFLNGTPKVLNYLDVLNYQFYNVEEQNLEKFETKYNLHNLMVEFEKDKNVEGANVPILKKLTRLTCQLADINIPTNEAKLTHYRESQNEADKIAGVLNKFLVINELKTLHLKSLHSWVQIIQVLTSDGVADKSDFILRVLQMVLPKINNEYYERDIQFAEELMSLCVLLFDLYEEDNEAALQDGTEHNLQRLLPLFKTCVNGVMSPNSTPTLRSDLYLLLNKFLRRSIKAEAILHHILSILRSIDKRFIDIVCNDSIYSEGVPRITSILFMESLIHLSTIENSSAILDVLIRNNSLSLLVRSLKRTDEIIVACGDFNDERKSSGINVDTLLYELTALKSTLYVLIRIAQTKAGASQLVQNEIFPVIKQLKILSIDADLGLDLQIDTSTDPHSNQNYALINLSLDVPLVLRSHVNPAMGDSSKMVSYYEFLVPAFQLVATVLLSLGPSYTPGILQVEQLMRHYHQFVVAIMKRDALLDKEKLGTDEILQVSFIGLKQLVRLLTLISSLVEIPRKEA